MVWFPRDKHYVITFALKSLNNFLVMQFYYKHVENNADCI